MSVVSLTKKNVSTHGSVLLRELNALHECDMEIVQECLSKDKLCVAVKVKESGGNAFHVVCARIDRYKTSEFACTLLREMCTHSKDYLNVQNNSGNTPLHQLLLTTDQLLPEMVSLLLTNCPSQAMVVNSAGETPLHAYIKRPKNDISGELCRELCRIYPMAPNLADGLGNLPIHYALKNRHPCRDVVKILLRRNPESTKVMSSAGQLPMHVVCGSSDDLECIRMVHEVYPDAIKTTDRHGRTCLHLVCLAVGREHSAETRRLEEQARLEAEAKKIASTGEDVDDGDGDDDNENDECKALSESQTRTHVHWVIDQFPRAMALLNHFQATPVDTVLEKTKQVVSKSKTVMVFGLADDPPTARILLTRQRHYATVPGSGVPALRTKYNQPLQDLNWLARKSAMLVCLVGESRPFASGAAKINPWGSNLQIGARDKSKEKEKEKAKKGDQCKTKSGQDKKETKGKPTIASNNLLARLQRVGQHSLVQVIVSYV